jgi:hypothetical protein
MQVKRSLGQFTPAYWDKDEWNPLMGPARFVQVLGLAILILIVEVNAFFLKLCLWIPPRNPLNSYRLLIWWLIANPAIREYNSFLQTRKPTKKLGAFCWLAVAIAIVETLICVKFGRGTICFQQMSLPNRFGKCGCILNKVLSSTMHSHHCEVLFMCSNTLSIWFLHLNANFVVDLILSCLFLQVSTPGQCLTGFFGPG